MGAGGLGKVPMNRRKFLRTLGLASAAAGLSSAGVACARSAAQKPAGDGRSRVALITDPGVRRGEEIDAKRVERLLRATLEKALGSTNLAGVLPADEVVGIKLNCLAGRPLSPALPLVEALIKILSDAGIPRERVIVFERGERDLRRGGFTPGEHDGVRYLGNDSAGAGYEEEPEISGQLGSCLSRILTRRIGAMINLGVLKDHSLAGLGAGTKNLYGLIHNPNKYHDNGCDPYLADLLAMPVVQKKLCLSILDGLTAQCHGGPGFSPAHAWAMNGLLASRDVIALDRVAWDVIEERRKQTGLPPLERENRAPRWLRTAASRGLGTDELSRIQVLREVLS